MGLFSRLKQERDKCDRCHEPFGVLASSHVVLGKDPKLVCDDCMELELADRSNDDVDDDTDDD